VRCRMFCVSVLPKIPLIEDLTIEPVPAGTMLLVEFTGASQWYNAVLTISSGWLKSGGKVSYNATPRLDTRRSQETRCGL
jgi:alkylhydroperoxidase family enzyme